MFQVEVLVIPVLSLMGLAFAFNSILRFAQRPHLATIAFGLLFGSSIILAMTFPIRLSDGIIFDLRNLLLGFCILYAGWRAGLLALFMAVSYRMYLGGAGMLSGVLALVLAYVIACAWRRFAVPRIQNPSVREACFGVAITFALAALLILPRDIALALLRDLAPLFIVTNIICAVALGFVLRREMHFFDESEKLRQYALADPLTSLLNRRGTCEKIENLNLQEGKARALYFFDLDHFKQVNDLHGHDAGDLALVTIADRLKKILRSDVIFSRHGGDEFTIFVPGIEHDSVVSLADRLCAAIATKPMDYKGTEIPLTISMGVHWTERHLSLEDMQLHADAQLLLAKERGRNRASIKLDVPGADLPHLETELAYAS